MHVAKMGSRKENLRTVRNVARPCRIEDANLLLFRGGWGSGTDAEAKVQAAQVFVRRGLAALFAQRAIPKLMRGREDVARGRGIE
jgi:hypothetical protein